MKDDTKTLADYKVKEEGAFIVCHVSKRRPAPKKKAEAPTAQTNSGATQQTGASAPGAGQAQQQGTVAPTATGNANTGAVQIRAEDVASLTGMGFAETDVRAALEATRGNLNAASQVLLDPSLLAQMQAQANESPLERFRRHPQLNQLRAMVQNNPQALQEIIQQIAQADPELHAAIQADQETFVNILNEPIPAGGGSTPPLVGQGPGGVPTPQNLQQLLEAVRQMGPQARQQISQQLGMNPEQLEQVTQLMQHMPPEILQRMAEDSMQNGNGPLGGALPGGQRAPPPTLQFTEEENQSIQRLQELGFSRNACIQAYLACEKDENAAANLLFTTPFDEDGQDGQGGNQNQ